MTPLKPPIVLTPTYENTTGRSATTIAVAAYNAGAGRQPQTKRPCPMCKGRGSISGFLLGTWKTCTSCHGKGLR